MSPARPKLSIITPSLNQGKFIERTITSVLDQGYENLEYVIVDGGSTDETLDVIRRYEDRLAWWASEPDDGQTDAINKGIERTSGEIVAYINSDDYYLPGAFDAAVTALDRGPERWVAGAARFVDGDGRLLEVWSPKPPQSTEGLLRGRHWWMLTPWGAPQPSSWWQRDLFERYGRFRRDMHFAFDSEFMLRLAYGGELPALIEDELSVRVVHEEAKSGGDLEPFRKEAGRFIELFAPALTERERRRLRIVRFLRATHLHGPLSILVNRTLRVAEWIGPRLPGFLRFSERWRRGSSSRP